MNYCVSYDDDDDDDDCDAHHHHGSDGRLKE
jgi:hypothetical protein